LSDLYQVLHPLFETGGFTKKSLPLKAISEYTLDPLEDIGVSGKDIGRILATLVDRSRIPSIYEVGRVKDTMLLDVQVIHFKLWMNIEVLYASLPRPHP